jgi:hypothetical protein
MVKALLISVFFLVAYENCAFLSENKTASPLIFEVMPIFVLHMVLLLVLGLLFFIQPSTEDRSVSDISGLGQEFVPVDNSLPPLLTCTAKTLLYCHLECNKRADCRTFDYDADSRQCRLWDADMTTGSIVASPSKPQSSVGTIQLSPSIYVNIQNQSCDKCFQSRYETCDTRYKQQYLSMSFEVILEWINVFGATISKSDLFTGRYVSIRSESDLSTKL